MVLGWLTMRIVYVLTMLGVGGTERQVLSLAGRMVVRGHTVALLVLRPTFAEELATDLAVVHLDMSKTPMSLLRGLVRGAGFLRSFQPDIIHSHNVHGNLVARMLKVFCSWAPVVSTIHNVYEGGWLRMAAYRVTDPLCTLSVAVSTAAAERYVRLKAVPRRKCRVICNGIDMVEFVPSLQRRNAVRERMGVKEEFLWITVGRVVPAKDYPNLLRAFAIVHEREADAHLWIAAETMGSDAGEMSKLGAQLGLNDRVCWLGLRHDVAALLDAADAFVLGSAWEGMPLALGEAMAMAKRVVATDVGGVRELVGDAGTIVASKNAAALAEAMLAVMETSIDIRKSQGRAARQRIANGFSIETKTDEWESMYRSVIED